MCVGGGSLYMYYLSALDQVNKITGEVVGGFLQHERKVFALIMGTCDFVFHQFSESSDFLWRTAICYAISDFSSFMNFCR